jgi:hypothetical protein
MTRQADRNAERQDPKGLGPEGMRAAVCGADAPTTSPMDKTVEVSQAAREEEIAWALLLGEYPEGTDRYAGLLAKRGTTLVHASAAIRAILSTTRATQPEAALREALACVDGDAEWLCNQLEQWPTRVHPERTTNISYLMKSAAKVIRAALNDHRHG